MDGRPPSRRTVLRAGIVLGATAWIGTSLPGCSPLRGGPTTPAATPTDTATGGTMASSIGQRVLLAYFSRPGENYWHGGRRTLRVGNTEVLATMISERTACEVYRIEAAQPYSADYDATVARNVREQDSDAHPGIAGALPDLAGYDTVILASPIWNVRPPMIMSTFVQASGLPGKRLLPVTTHAMSGRVFDYTTDLDGVVPAYQAMLDRRAIKSLLRVGAI